jgi:hypothetical protein
MLQDTNRDLLRQRADDFALLWDLSDTPARTTAADTAGAPW